MSDIRREVLQTLDELFTALVDDPNGPRYGNLTLTTLQLFIRKRLASDPERSYDCARCGKYWKFHELTMVNNDTSRISGFYCPTCLEEEVKQSDQNPYIVCEQRHTPTPSLPKVGDPFPDGLGTVLGIVEHPDTEDTIGRTFAGDE